jgi:hypothetical protein
VLARRAIDIFRFPVANGDERVVRWLAEVGFGNGLNEAP